MGEPATPILGVDQSLVDAAVARAREFIAGSHYCDVDRDANGQHRHDACDCPCSVCFSFWHWNILRYEEARKLVREADRG